MSFLSSFSCRRARAWISRALDDDLDEASRLALSAHIGGCAECRRHQEVLEQGSDLMREATVEPSENFEWKVQLGIQRALRESAAERSDPTARPSGFWRPAMISASAVAVLVVGIGIGVLGSLGQPSPMFGDGSRSLAVDAAEAPDLSGAIPSTPFEIDAVHSGFGIRTVGTAARDPRFQGDVYAPVREATRHLRAASPVLTPPVVDPGVLRGFPSRSTEIRDLRVLNLRIVGSRLPQASTGADSAASANGVPR